MKEKFNFAGSTVGYTLEGKKPIPCRSVIEWAQWFEKADRRVTLTKVSEQVSVSTVFLGLDHGLLGGKPLLFETMVFGGEHDGFALQYTTWEEAEAGHQKVIEMLFEVRKVNHGISNTKEP